MSVAEVVGPAGARALRLDAGITLEQVARGCAALRTSLELRTRWRFRIGQNRAKPADSRCRRGRAG